jgi:hypothetical protein
MLKYVFFLLIIFPFETFSQNFASSISTPNPVLCGNRSSTKLTVFPQGPQYTYFWSYSAPNGRPFSLDGVVDSTIIVSKSGTYGVFVRDDLGNTSSSYIIISNIPLYKVTDLNGINNVININQGDTASIKVNFIGDNSPFSFDYFEDQIKHVISSQTSTYILKVNPTVNQKITFNNVGNSTCGVTSVPFGPNSTILDYAEIKVGVQPTFDFNIPTQMPSVCKFGRIPIPITKFGNWGNNKSVLITLVDQNNNYQISSDNNFRSDNNSDTLFYDVGEYFGGIGNFKFKLEFREPFINYPIYSSYFVNITTTGCITPPARIEFSGNNCNGYNLRALPQNSNGYTYIWKNNGTQVATGSNFSPTQPGNYSVQIINSSLGYNSTSRPFTITNSNTVGLEYYNNALNNCNLNSFLNPSFLIPGNLYQWYYSPTEYGYAPILGATNSSLQTSNAGNYFLQKKSGKCESRINYLCPLIINNFTSIYACPQSNVTINTNFLVYQSIRIQLLNATTNAVVYSNWIFNTTPPSGTPSSTFTVMLPQLSEAPYGTYKFRIVSTNGQILSLPSQSILTIGAPKPSLTTTPRYISSTGNSVLLKATNCIGQVIWSNSFVGFAQTNFISSPQVFTAYCSQVSNSSCISPNESIAILSNCAFDNYEPNDSKISASQISALDFESNPNCLGTGQDIDWFKFVNNGQLFFVKINSFQGTYYPGQYNLKKIINNNVLTLETLPVDLGGFINTVVTLYDSTGTNQIAFDDNGNFDGFSKIILDLNTLCQINVNLISPIYDILINEKSIVKGIQINASNIVNNLSITNYRSESSILLNSGFETKISTNGYFKAEIKNCSNNN